MTQEQNFDLIVLGAGPSGASAARTAAQAGLRVVLVDRAEFPRDKLCGGGLTGRAQGFLAEIYDPLPPEMLHRVGQFRLRHQGEDLGLLPSDPPFQTIMRRRFDAELRAQALAAGAVDFAARRVARIDPDLGAVTLADGTELRAPLLIGADGVKSQLARTLWGQSWDLAGTAFALEVEAPPFGDPDVLEIDLGAANWGYGWAFPKTDSVTLGIGGLAPENPDLKGRFADWLAENGYPTDLRIKGHHLPFGGFPEVPGEGRCLLVGDAAGLVDPITGEGIAWAIHSGRLAGHAAVRALAEGSPGVALRHYAAALAPVQAELRFARRLRALIFSAPLRGRFMRMAARHPKVQRKYLDLLHGRRDYAGLTGGSVWRLLRRMLLPALDRSPPNG